MTERLYSIIILFKNIDIKKAKWNGDVKIDDHYELTTDIMI